MPDLWSGRLPGGLDPMARQFTTSLHVDWRLAPYDIRGSLAHAQMLKEVGLLNAEEYRAIASGLQELLADVERGASPWVVDAEDVHSAVEIELTRRIGPIAGKLHTARSRNDQVALDMHLFVVDAAHDLQTRLTALAHTLVSQAERHQDIPFPGYTHLQPGQPVTLGHHWLAYVWMLLRDRARLHELAQRASRSPLGAGALAGSTLPIDPEMTAKLVGLAEPYENSLDAVSDRDFLLEFLSALSIIAVHLSRLSEELILWSTREFGFIELPDAWATGSSMMPQKKNPDVLELIRGRAGVVIGQMVALFTVVKGLPLAYNRDLQEDKALVFEAVDVVSASLDAIAQLVQGLTIRPERIAADVGPELLATDRAEQLVRQGVPFREAHRTVAAQFRHLPDGPASPEDIAHSLSARDRTMGPGPTNLQKQIAKARQLLTS